VNAQQIVMVILAVIAVAGFMAAIEWHDRRRRR